MFCGRWVLSFILKGDPPSLLVGFAVQKNLAQDIARSRSASVVVLLAVAGFWLIRVAAADTFVLDSGGQVAGQWLNREDSQAVGYQLRRDGVTVVLGADRVKEAVRQLPGEIEYARRAPATLDTADAQWELAEWCRSAGLANQRAVHLKRVIEIDPSHQRARQALGYQFLKGEWIVRAAARRQEGYELYRGKWRTPQEIEILQQREKSERVEKDWLAQLKKWRRDLDDPGKHLFAFESLSEIRDPAAVGPIAQYFAKERVRKVKVLYADILARIDTPAAVQVLIDRALNDPDEEVFHYCLGTLVEKRHPRVTMGFVAALSDANNFKVNRGAVALARLADKSTVSALIEALVTSHVQVVRQGMGGEATTSSFGSDGSFMKKGDGPEAVVYHVQNQTVLDTLAKLTGANYGFDEKAWRHWYAQDKIAREAAQPLLDARRQ